MDYSKFLVSLTFIQYTVGNKKRTQHLVTRYVSGITHGKDDKVKSVTHTADRSKALPMSKFKAEEVAALYAETNKAQVVHEKQVA